MPYSISTLACVTSITLNRLTKGGMAAISDISQASLTFAGYWNRKRVRKYCTNSASDYVTHLRQTLSIEITRVGPWHK